MSAYKNKYQILRDYQFLISALKLIMHFFCDSNSQINDFHCLSPGDHHGPVSQQIILRAPSFIIAGSRGEGRMGTIWIVTTMQAHLQGHYSMGGHQIQPC